MNLNFHLRATHGKVYYPWKFSDAALHVICAEQEQAWEVQNTFATKINRRYKDLVVERHAHWPRQLDSGEDILHSVDYYMARLKARRGLPKPFTV